LFDDLSWAIIYSNSDALFLFDSLIFCFISS
jgi:hypothetical protein